MADPLTVSLIHTTQAIVTRTFITFTVLMMNNSPNTVTNIVGTSTLPNGYSYASGTPGVTFSNGVVTYTLGSIGSGNGAYFSFSAHAANPGDYTNDINISYKVGTNDYSEVVSGNTTVYPDLILTITAPSTVTRGSSFSYTFTVTNPNGNPSFTDIKLRNPQTGWSSPLPMISVTNDPVTPFDSVSLTTFLSAQESSLVGGESASAKLNMNVPGTTTPGNYGNPMYIEYRVFSSIYSDIEFLPIVQVV